MAQRPSSAMLPRRQQRRGDGDRHDQQHGKGVRQSAGEEQQHAGLHQIEGQVQHQIAALQPRVAAIQRRQPDIEDGRSGMAASSEFQGSGKRR